MLLFIIYYLFFRERLVKSPWEGTAPTKKPTIAVFPREVSHKAHYQGSGVQAIEVPSHIPSLKAVHGPSTPVKSHVSQITLTPTDPIPSFRQARPDSIVQSPRKDLASQFSLI